MDGGICEDSPTLTAKDNSAQEGELYLARKEESVLLYAT